MTVREGILHAVILVAACAGVTCDHPWLILVAVVAAGIDRWQGTRS